MDNKKGNKMVKFEVGNIYGMRYIGDSSLITEWICVNRTEKTIYLERFKDKSEKLTRRVKVYNNVEFVVEGSYSMAPSVYADKIVG